VPVVQKGAVRAAHMIKLTPEREITPYPWVHPDDDDRR
jgi:hypothetical protein